MLSYIGTFCAADCCIFLYFRQHKQNPKVTKYYMQVLDLHLVDLSIVISLFYASVCIRCAGLVVKGKVSVSWYHTMLDIDLVIPQSKSPYYCCIYRMLIGGDTKETVKITRDWKQRYQMCTWGNLWPWIHILLDFGLLIVSYRITALLLNSRKGHLGEYWIGRCDIKCWVYCKGTLSSSLTYPTHPAFGLSQCLKP